jgi:anti-sigma B factor antagonist
MTDLSILTRKLDGASVLEPTGFINAHTVKQFESELEGIIGEGRYNILINCRSLNYISSAGLGAIMGQIETVRENGGDIVLSNLQENVFLIFDTLGFTQLYRVFPQEQDALAALTEVKGS